jgi:hypothetical protein
MNTVFHLFYMADTFQPLCLDLNDAIIVLKATYSLTKILNIFRDESAISTCTVLHPGHYLQTVIVFVFAISQILVTLKITVYIYYQKGINIGYYHIS